MCIAFTRHRFRLLLNPCPASTWSVSTEQYSGTLIFFFGFRFSFIPFLLFSSVKFSFGCGVHYLWNHFSRTVATEVAEFLWFSRRIRGPRYLHRRPSTLRKLLPTLRRRLTKSVSQFGYKNNKIRYRRIKNVRWFLEKPTTRFCDFSSSQYLYTTCVVCIYYLPTSFAPSRLRIFFFQQT